jgi:hypothetical protein
VAAVKHVFDCWFASGSMPTARCAGFNFGRHKSRDMLLVQGGGVKARHACMSSTAGLRAAACRTAR